MKQFLRFWCFASGLVIVAGLLQQGGWFVLRGVKPNLLLVAAFSLIFFVHDFLTYVSLLMLSALMFQMRGGIDAAPLVFFAIPSAAFFARRILPWKVFVNAALVIAFGTVFFYALLDWDFVAQARREIISEIVYNMVTGIGLFFVIDRFSGHERQARTIF